MTNQPPSMPYSAPQPAPGPSSVERSEGPKSRAPWIAAVAVLGITTLGLGIFAVVSSSAANEARAERDDLREEVLDVDASLQTAETELADTATSLTEAQDALTEAEAATDTLQEERDDLQADLTEAQDAVVEDANPFATQADLDGFRMTLSDYRELLTTAQSIDELTPFFFTFDSDFDRLVSLNVTTELSECKTVLENNGFATTIIVASSIASLLEFEPDLLDEAQAEIAAGESIAKTVFDQACGPLPEG